MSCTFSWPCRWRRIQVTLTLLAQKRVQKLPMRQRSPEPEQQLHAHIRQVATALNAEMGIWQIEDCLESKAHVACWHRDLSTYRDYILCADAAERTFLIDTRTWAYLAIANGGLVQIDGVSQAKRFVDALCALQAQETSHATDKGRLFSRQPGQAATL